MNIACIGGRVDIETGCYRPNCDENGIFESCRQSFYLKQQNEILKQSSQQQQTATPANRDQTIIDKQNQQITQLIQSSEQSAHKIENLNLVNTILTVALVLFACAFLVVSFMKRTVAGK